MNNYDPEKDNSSQKPYDKPAEQKDPLDRISGPSPLERISTSLDPLDRISRRRRNGGVTYIPLDD